MPEHFRFDPTDALACLSEALRLLEPRERAIHAHYVVAGSGRASGPGVGQVFPEAKMTFLLDDGWEVAWDSGRVRCRAGDVVCITADTPHAERVLNAGPLRQIVLWTAGDDVHLHLSELRPVLVARVRASLGILAVHGRVIADLIRLLADPRLARPAHERCWLLLRDLLKSACRSPTIERWDTVQILEAGRQLIEAHFADPAFTIRALAARLDLHPGSLARRWRQLTGESPSATLANRRIRAAQHLLLHTQASIAAIAERCGFTCQDSFIRAFRRATGQPPRAWQEMGLNRITADGTG